MLTQAEINAIADAVVERLHQKPAAVGDWLTREQAETHLNVSRATFLRLRSAHPIALAPACPHPLRFSRKALDLFQMTGGVIPTAPRRGRRPKNWLIG